MELTHPPPLRVLLERCSATVRVDIEAVGDVALDAVEESYGVDLPSELARLLSTAAELPPASAVPAVRTLVDAHLPSSRAFDSGRSVLNQSSGPQEVLRIEDYKAIQSGTA
ncbi:MAG: hypothetical protein ACXV98_09690 [Ilumatobacteraceae bacterium]